MSLTGRERGPDGRHFPDDYTASELRMIATRALAEGDDYSRALLREQLEAEEFTDATEIGADRLWARGAG